MIRSSFGLENLFLFSRSSKNFSFCLNVSLNDDDVEDDDDEALKESRLNFGLETDPDNNCEDITVDEEEEGRGECLLFWEDLEDSNLILSFKDKESSLFEND